MNEADYICFLAKSISEGRYQKGGFVVLLYLANDAKSVHFPDLGYSQEFWSTIKKCKAENLGDEFPKMAVEEVVKKLSENKKSILIRKEGFDVEILETKYGTCGSYFVKDNKIFITKRTGDPTDSFEKTFLLAKIKAKNKDDAEIGVINWHKRNAVVEYFYGKEISKLGEKEIKESNLYLKKLGFLSEDIIDEIDFKVFTVQEENLLKCLFEAKGQIITFDKTAQILWGEDSYNKYSPQAMAKVVESIRTKIRDQGINREVVFTKRGRGYCLVG